MRKEKLLATALLTIMLAACGGDEQTATFHWKSAELAYSYPYQGQYEVPLAAPLVLHFSEPVQADESELLDRVELFRLDDEGETKITLEVASLHEVDAPHPVSVVLRPATGKLDPATSYRVDLGELSTDLSELGVPPDGISFRTRGERDSARSRMGDDTFFVSRMVPDGSDLQVLDFSALRVQFSQPVDRDSLRYGDTLALLDEDDALVDARVYLKGHYLTVAPNEELEPGREYRLVQEGAGLRSVGGDTLDLINGNQLASFVPENTRPRATMVQQARSSEDDDSLVSRLTGAVINAVPVTAVLLGEPDDNVSYQSGDVFAELGHVPSFPEAVPLRVPRGNLLKGSSLEVKVAGEVPAGFETGEISVDFISDAVGYMIPNDFNRNRANKNMPRHIRLMMDIAMTAEDPEANAALSQDLLHVELAGIARVRDGVMEIDAVGVVEPEVLGLETASGLLSFNMVAYENQKSAPQMIPDSEGPALQSWVPGEDHQGSARRGDPIILNFTKPLDPGTLEKSGALSLTKDNSPQGFDVRLDGASIVIHPEGGLRHNVEYKVSVSSILSDMAGNPIEDDYELSFSLPDKESIGDRSPILISTMPGFPCPTQGEAIGGNPEHHGRCRGGEGDDDLLPVTGLDKGRPIEAHFSQEMDEQSFVLGETFQVHRQVNGVWESVQGRLDTAPRKIRFWPDADWQSGELYRYTIRSTPEHSPQLCGQETVCSRAGLPLQTRLLAEDIDEAPSQTDGGPDMEIHFRGTESSNSVFQPLRNLPVTDINSDFVLQDEEFEKYGPEPDPDGGYKVPENATELEITGTGTLLWGANVGCGYSWFSPETCPERKFIYMTGALNGDVVGYDPEEEAVRVDVYPTQIVTTSIDVHAWLTFIPEVVPTGPQVMRIRYQENEQGDRTEPVTGYIRETEDGPVFEVELDLYLDAPWLNPSALGIGLSHNQHSYPLDGVRLEGPVAFLDDGRMQIRQRNLDPIEVDVVIGGGAASMDMRIPEGGIHLLYTSMPVKE